MKKTGLVLMLLMFTNGCAQQHQLALVDAAANPAKFSSGDETLISVRVIDPQGLVTEVTATVRQYTSIILELNDSGRDGDKVAGDGVWSITFDVPYGAEEGEYHWDFEAFDDSGDPVMVTTEGGEVPITAEAAVEVVY